MSQSANLFQEAQRRFNVIPDRRGECHRKCPNCGKEPARGQTHFSFNANSGHCFVCGWSCSLAQLLGQPHRRFEAAPPIAKPKRVVSWRWEAAEIVREACQAPDRLERWQAYRPLSLDAIARWRLGVGVAPETSCQHRRLLFPVYRAGRIVALVGRRLDCECPAKVLVATGSETVLFNGEALRPGAEVVVTENRIDAILAGEVWPEIVAVGAGSTSYWRAFVDEIAASRPARVTVWFDNDAAGCPNAGAYAAYERRQAAAGQAPVEPAGVQFVNALRKRGIKAEPWYWPRDTPAKYDPGAFMTDLVLSRRQSA